MLKSLFGLVHAYTLKKSLNLYHLISEPRCDAVVAACSMRFSAVRTAKGYATNLSLNLHFDYIIQITT